MASSPKTTEAERLARRCDPHVWALEPPDASTYQHRQLSLIDAKVRLAELVWNPASEKYEVCRA